MIGIGGLIGMMIGISERLTLDLNITLMLLFVIAGLVGFSRLSLNAHNSLQVYAGFLVGMGSLLIMILAA
jgi:membrane-associated phospholipid phosphatase